jgi:hypothetical protein
MITTVLPASPETAEWINARYRDGIRLGGGGPLIRGTSLEHKPAMWRSDGVLIVVVEHALKRHRMLKFKPSRTLTLITEGPEGES